MPDLNMLKDWKYTVPGVILLLLILSYFYGLLVHITGERDFAVSKELNIRGIHIIPPEGESIYLEKNKKEEKWLIDNNYYANEFAVRDLIRVVRHHSVRQPVSVSKRKEINKELDNNGIAVDIYVDAHLFDFFNLFGLINIQRRNKSIIVGRNTPDAKGTYMKIAESDNPYIVYLPGFSKGIAGAFTPKKQVWFDPEIINLKPQEISKIKITNNEKPDESFILEVSENYDFAFYDIESNPICEELKVDTIRVLRYLSLFNNLYYETLLDDEGYEKSEELISSDYVYKVEVEDNKNNLHRFTAFRRYKEDACEYSVKKSDSYDPDRFYIELDNRQRAVAQYYVFGRVLRQLSFFEVDN